MVREEEKERWLIRIERSQHNKTEKVNREHLCNEFGRRLLNEFTADRKETENIKTN